MTDEILEILMENGGQYVSGQEISRKLGVTRETIWKAVKSLRNHGYKIDSVTNKGYMLAASPDLLSRAAIWKNLKTNYMGRRFYHYDSLGSTSVRASELARNGTPEGTVVVSEEQCSGRGRLGRRWYSPTGAGIWMSIVLRPSLLPDAATVITAVAANSVLDSIREYAPHAEIKKPNDILSDGKKLCGILTDINGELEMLDWAVVGIGVNVNETDFPEDIRDVAVSLRMICGNSVPRPKIAAEILNKFENNYEKLKIKTQK